MDKTFDLELFFATYVNTNVGPGSVKFDHAFVLEKTLGDLKRANNEVFSKVGVQILVAICCAMKRADLVPQMFQAIAPSTQSVLELFYETRETIEIIWPFVGVPQVIPAALGLAGILKSHGIQQPDIDRKRADITPSDVRLGNETRRSIYKASANNEVFEMLSTFHGDFAYALNAVGFGYNIGRSSRPLPESELILTAALIGLNASRQAGSHIRACVSFGYSETDIEAIVRITEDLAKWQGPEIFAMRSPIDVRKLASQARANMAPS